MYFSPFDELLGHHIGREHASRIEAAIRDVNLPTDAASYYCYSTAPAISWRRDNSAIASCGFAPENVLVHALFRQWKLGK
jgi:hypothetical protein